MNKLIFGRLTLVICLILISRTACALDTSSPITLSSSSLFVEYASNGSLSGPDDQSLRLTHRGIDKEVAVLSYSPLGEVNKIRNSLLYEEWDSWYGLYNPKAVLSYREPGKKTRESIILSLSNPFYDEKKKILSFGASLSQDSLGTDDSSRSAIKAFNVKKKLLSPSLMIESSVNNSVALTDNTSMYCEGVSTGAANCSFKINGQIYFMFSLTKTMPALEMRDSVGNAVATLNKGSEFYLRRNVDLSYTVLFLYGTVTDTGYVYNFGSVELLTFR